MMGMLWVVLFVALTGAQVGQGLPLRQTPPAYPHDSSSTWIPHGWDSNVAFILPALALLLTAASLLFGCTWCFHHKDCKPDEGADNQLFTATANAATLHNERRPTANPPDSGFSEPANNNISEDNNNGPISLREMQNIANNNAAVYITSENEQRNRLSRESVVEFEPLPRGIGVVDPLERVADWFGGEDLPRNRLQYLREIGRGWFGRVVEGEIEEQATTSAVAVKILGQDASLEDKARFLLENRLYKDVQHEGVLRLVAKCLQEDPWMLLFELCSMDLQHYLETNRPKMAILNENGVPLQLMCDVTSALTYLHSRGLLYGNVSSGNVLVREGEGGVRAVLGSYTAVQPAREFAAPECLRHPPVYTSSSEVWSLGTLIWEVSAWGETPARHPPPPPALPFPYSAHLYQVMQLCWAPTAEARPSSAQVHALVGHLLAAHARGDAAHGDYGSSDFEARWQRLKPNSIPKVDEHVAIVHAPSTSHFEHPPDAPSLEAGPLSRSSSVLSDQPSSCQLSTQPKSDSLNNLHGSLEDVRNIYLTHNETAAIECHQGNIAFEDKEDRSDSSVDPWLKDIIAGSQDDVSYYKDVSDVIKNLDNILNSEKTSSSESSHQASPSRDNLSLDCKKEAPVPSSLVKSPGISNFQNVLETGLDAEGEQCEDDGDRDTIGTLSHSFERHSDTTSQHTLENLTPDTPVKEPEFSSQVVSPVAAETSPLEIRVWAETDLATDPGITKEGKHSLSKLPNLRELSVTSLTSVSETEPLNVREDGVPPCDSYLDAIVRTEVETKSVGKLNENQIVDEESNAEIESANVSKMVQKETEQASNEIEIIEEERLPVTVAEIANNLIEKEVIQPAVETVYRMQENNRINHVQNEIKITTLVGSMPTAMQRVQREVRETVHPDLIIPFEQMAEKESEKVDRITTNRIQHEIAKIISEDTSVKEVANEIKPEPVEHKLDRNIPEGSTETPEPVQSLSDDITEVTNETEKLETSVSEDTLLPTETTDNLQTSTEPDTYPIGDKVEEVKGLGINVVDGTHLSDQSNESTVYMDLINDTNTEAKPCGVDNFRDGVLERTNVNNDSCFTNESTVYLDLPSILRDTDEFLHSERIVYSQIVEQADNVCASTPKGSDTSANTTQEDSNLHENFEISDTKIPEDSAVATQTLEQKNVPETTSPFESPTKSHPTDTYEENSSVLLGPFESSTEYRSVKEADIPKEELLAFSSNFSEINLEPPSLPDENVPNETPETASDHPQFDDIKTCEIKPENQEPESENSKSDQSSTTIHISPSTPPNSPGMPPSTSQQKYMVIDVQPSTSFHSHPDPSRLSWQKELDINQIEMHITSKLAMAENENNMNIEYSGPLTVEGIVSDEDVILRDNEAVPEAVLAGNGGSVEELREFSLDEECVNALRNELELKLPLAQVAAGEPPSEPECEQDWSELPPPPEMIVCYAGGALSPIAEETRHQLSAYENDAWNASARTDSSESYLEPCNNSTDEVTDLPTGTQPSGSGSDNHSTYTIETEDSANDTYTVQKDVPSSKDITMSPDSLNSPYRKPRQPQTQNEPLSPIDDETHNKNDDGESCEHISQVSPCLLSPTTGSSAPGDSPTDNATALSTLKTTVPTDVPKEEGLSKATSIDSWCSNDTLYNVEENFDDLAVEADIANAVSANPECDEGENPIANAAGENPKDDSEGTDTLTHDEDRDQSHCSTYIIHDSDSECDTFSPDSITDKDNYTYTKVKTELSNTPSIVEKSEANDATKNTQPVDLAYGTLPSYSNCTTEVVSSMKDPWMLPQPEMIRRSPTCEVDVTPPKIAEADEGKIPETNSPKITRPSVNKMDSVEITCLRDNSLNCQHKPGESEGLGTKHTFTCDYSNMTPSITSTPLVDPVPDEDNVEPIPMVLPSITVPNAINATTSIPNLQAFMQSAEIRPQDISSNSNEPSTNTGTDTGLLLEGESKLNSNRDSMIAAERTPNYLDFESSAVLKPQELHSNGSSRSQNFESGLSSGDFRQFENSVRNRPQDLSPIDASAMFLNGERKSNELAPSPNEPTDPSQLMRHETPLDVDVNPPNIANIVESQPLVFNNETFDAFVTDLDEETDQPHSIIITDVSKDIPFSPKSAETTHNSGEDETYDSHTKTSLGLSDTYDSHLVDSQPVDREIAEALTINGVSGTETELEQNEKTTVETRDLFETLDTSHQNSKENGADHSKEPSAIQTTVYQIQCNGTGQNYATVQFLNEDFEELIENDDNSVRDDASNNVKGQESLPVSPKNNNSASIGNPNEKPAKATPSEKRTELNGARETVGVNGTVDNETKMAAATNDFLQNEKEFCQIDSYLPLLSDIRFSGPTTEIMSTSFSQDSPTGPASPECEEDNKQDPVADLVKEWDSDSESHSSNSSSGEFIWKGGGGVEAAFVPTNYFDYQRSSGGAGAEGAGGGGSAAGSGDSGSGSEGDEVEFVPSSWDCRAEPAKSSLRSLQQTPDSKKRVVFKRQKYHCVYEYPREVIDLDTQSPYLPDLSTYTDWDGSGAEEAELGYGQLFGAPSPLDMYPLRGGTFGADYDEDFFISSSARPFEALGVMSTTSQFFPGMHSKAHLERDVSVDVDAPPPAPLALPPGPTQRTPSLDFTTPDSGVEDVTPITPGSVDDGFKAKKVDEVNPWKPVDSASSSESVSPSSPGGEALGGLRHTRDKLKLDLPPSPHIPSPRHNRVFNFILDKPKRHRHEEKTTPLIMSDETPVVTSSLPLDKDSEDVATEPTFSTFGKDNHKNGDADNKMVLTDEIEEEKEVKEQSPVKETVKGEGTVLDSGDEDSGIESSSKASLERKTNVS